MQNPLLPIQSGTSRFCPSRITNIHREKYVIESVPAATGSEICDPVQEVPDDSVQINRYAQITIIGTMI